MSSPESHDPYARDTRVAFLAVLIALILWGAAIAIFGYPGLIIPAVGLTFAMFGLIAVLMRG